MNVRLVTDEACPPERVYARVIDDWAPPELVRAANAEWPDERWPHWHRYEGGKLATKDVLRFPPACAELVRRMLCLPIEELTGVPDAFGDWNCHGAGLHALPPGTSLGVHLDSDHHPLTGWRRAVNGILFVNPIWCDSWGGELAFYSPDGKHRVAGVEPRFNRLVLFVPNDTTYHAVAEVTGPETRKTLAVFFWQLDHAKAHRRDRAQFVRQPAEEYAGGAAWQK